MIYTIIGILLSVAILLTSVELIAFNMSRYAISFEKYNISVETGMDKDNLEYVIQDLLAYLRDEKDVLDTEAVVKGEQRVVFGERERFHMIDVKEMFVKGWAIRNTSFTILGLLALIVIVKDKLWKRNLSKSLFYTGVGSISLLGVFVLLIYYDFNKYVTYFHQIFFNNDLWILDPKTEILIQMVPEGFFYDTAFKIISLFVGSISIIGALGYILHRNQVVHKANYMQEEKNIIEKIRTI